jgi:DNA-directed RNA polymerase subunit RPC12/RpoP
MITNELLYQCLICGRLFRNETDEDDGAQEGSNPLGTCPRCLRYDGPPHEPSRYRLDPRMRKRAVQ